MKAKFKGADTGRLKKGIHEVTIHGNIVSVKGQGFNYTFTYLNKQQMEKDWEVIE